jgi:hypothetical protein
MFLYRSVSFKKMIAVVNYGVPNTIIREMIECDYNAFCRYSIDKDVHLLFKPHYVNSLSHFIVIT